MSATEPQRPRTGRTTTTITAAVVQICAGQDVRENLGRAEALVTSAAARGAELVVLPENFAYIRSLQDKLALAEPLSEAHPGPIVGAMQALARRLGIHLVLGGTPIVGPDASRFYNTCIVIGREGKFLATYRKIHLFDVNIPRGAQFVESQWVAPGEAPTVADVLGRRLGLTICYDLRFPELYQQLATMGAELITVPAAFTLHTGKDHWMPLLRARAIENQVFVLAAGQHGWHTDTRATYGKSCIVDPWGTVLAQCPDTDAVAVAELDFGYLDRVRREMPCLTHRRLRR